MEEFLVNEKCADVLDELIKDSLAIEYSISTSYRYFLRNTIYNNYSKFVWIKSVVKEAQN